MPFGIYLHFPFCRNRCHYCDFYKELHDPALEQRFFAALSRETELAAERLVPPGTEITSIFIGGGTPSLALPEHLAVWLTTLRKHVAMADSLEFSIEMNPESITLELLRTYRNLGINRPVLGIQSFHAGLLKTLGRRHNPHHSQQAVYWLNVLGFANWGADVIFGLPGQTGRLLEIDLDQLTDLEPPHVSLYELTVEPGTRLALDIAAGKAALLSPELRGALHRAAVSQLEDAGYGRYEVSAFAQPGFECRHNMGYWRGDDYLGLGPGAHSFLNGQRFANRPDLRAYLDAFEGRGPAEAILVPDHSGPHERMTEAVMLGLRTAEGISRTSFRRRFAVDLDSVLDSSQMQLLVESDFVAIDDTSVRLTAEGLYYADEITRRLLK